MLVTTLYLRTSSMSTIKCLKIKKQRCISHLWFRHCGGVYKACFLVGVSTMEILMKGYVFTVCQVEDREL